MEVLSQGAEHLDFLGLAGSMFRGYAAASLLADAINTLPASNQAAEAETVEILQGALAEPARCQLHVQVG